jgi:lysyl-tRNA synthetase class 2
VIPDWRPTASIANLRRRAELLRATRDFLDRLGYLEVETPLLSADACVDVWLDPISVPDFPRRGRVGYLQTSPEFAMKRLLAAGSGSIYQLGKAFRRDESGPKHNLEFTIVEWYRVGGSAEPVMRETAGLAALFAGDRPISFTPYRQAFLTHAGIDPFLATDAELATVATAHGLADANSPRDDLLNFLLAALVEPNLGRRGFEFLIDYPPSQAALARVRPDADGLTVAGRFELYLEGVELANGFEELVDADVLRARNIEANVGRRGAGKEELPVESRLLEAMRAGLPESVGVAVGFDRLMMIALGAADLAETIAFPADRA